MSTQQVVEQPRGGHNEKSEELDHKWPICRTNKRAKTVEKKLLLLLLFPGGAAVSIEEALCDLTGSYIKCASSEAFCTSDGSVCNDCGWLCSAEKQIIGGFSNPPPLVTYMDLRGLPNALDLTGSIPSTLGLLADTLACELCVGVGWVGWVGCPSEPEVIQCLLCCREHTTAHTLASFLGRFKFHGSQHTSIFPFSYLPFFWPVNFYVSLSNVLPLPLCPLCCQMV